LSDKNTCLNDLQVVFLRILGIKCNTILHKDWNI